MRIENQQGRARPILVLPKLHKLQDRIGLFPLLEGGIGITQHQRIAILDQKDQDRALPATAGGDIMFLSTATSPRCGMA